MKKHYPQTEAVSLLVKNSLPTEAELDAMDANAVAAFLSSQGVDVGKFRAELGELKKQVTGKVALSQARQHRLASAAKRAEVTLINLSTDELVSALLKKFGSYEEMPLAARNHKEWNREDWESLYRDTFLSGNC